MCGDGLWSQLIVFILNGPSSHNNVSHDVQRACLHAAVAAGEKEEVLSLFGATDAANRLRYQLDTLKFREFRPG